MEPTLMSAPPRRRISPTATSEPLTVPQKFVRIRRSWSSWLTSPREP